MPSLDIPNWPAFSTRVLREAMVEDKRGILGPKGQLASLTQHNAVAVVGFSRVNGRRVLASVVGGAGSARLSDVDVVESLRPFVRAGLQAAVDEACGVRA